MHGRPLEAIGHGTLPGISLLTIREYVLSHILPRYAHHGQAGLDHQTVALNAKRFPVKGPIATYHLVQTFGDDPRIHIGYGQSVARF